MIDYIKGTIAELNPTQIVVECGNIGVADEATTALVMLGFSKPAVGKAVIKAALQML